MLLFYYTDNNILTVPQTEEVLKFFNLYINDNLQYTAKLPIDDDVQHAKALSKNNNGSNTSGMAVSESAGKTLLNLFFFYNKVYTSYLKYYYHLCNFSCSMLEG